LSNPGPAGQRNHRDHTDRQISEGPRPRGTNLKICPGRAGLVECGVWSVECAGARGDAERSLYGSTSQLTLGRSPRTDRVRRARWLPWGPSPSRGRRWPKAGCRACPSVRCNALGAHTRANLAVDPTARYLSPPPTAARAPSAKPRQSTFKAGNSTSKCVPAQSRISSQRASEPTSPHVRPRVSVLSEGSLVCTALTEAVPGVIMRKLGRSWVAVDCVTIPSGPPILAFPCLSLPNAATCSL
jgi:hypothetical protein